MKPGTEATKNKQGSINTKGAPAAATCPAVLGFVFYHLRACCHPEKAKYSLI